MNPDTSLDDIAGLLESIRRNLWQLQNENPAGRQP